MPKNNKDCDIIRIIILRGLAIIGIQSAILFYYTYYYKRSCHYMDTECDIIILITIRGLVIIWIQSAILLQALL